MEMKKLGLSSIVIPRTNVSMSIHIDSHCRVELRAKRKSEDEALNLVEKLRRDGDKPSMYVDGEYKKHNGLTSGRGGVAWLACGPVEQ